MGVAQAEEVTTLISSMLSLPTADGGPIEKEAAKALQDSVAMLTTAATVGASPTILTSSKLNVTIKAASNSTELSKQPMRGNTSSGALAEANVPEGVLEGVAGFDASKPIQGLLYTTPGAALHPPLRITGSGMERVSATALYSPMVSFSLLQEGVALKVKKTSRRINVSIPAAEPSDPEMKSECRWHDASGAWPSTGCQTIVSNNGVVTCSCDHLTDFVVFQVPRNQTSWLNARAQKLAQETARARREKLKEACDERGADLSAMGWSASFVVLFLGAVLIAHSLYRDIRHGPLHLPEHETKAWYEASTDANHGKRTRLPPAPPRTVALRSLFTRHPLLAGVFSRGLRGFTRTQTVLIMYNTFALEMLVSCWLVVSAVASPPVNTAAVILGYGSLSAFLMLFGSVFFAMLFQPFLSWRLLVETSWFFLEPLVRRRCPSRVDRIWPTPEVEKLNLASWFAATSKGNVTLPPRPPRPMTPEPWEPFEAWLAELQPAVDTTKKPSARRRPISARRPRSARERKVTPAQLPHTITKGESYEERRDKKIRMQVVSFASLNADKHMVVEDMDEAAPDLANGNEAPPEIWREPKKKKGKGKKEKKGKTGKKESASSEEEEASAPPSPPASPPPLSGPYTDGATSGSGSTLSPGKINLAARTKVSAVSRLSSAKIAAAPAPNETSTATAAELKAASKLFGADPYGAGGPAPPKLSLAAAAKMSAASAKLAAPLRKSDSEKALEKKVAEARRKETARRARRELWRYRIRYIKAYIRRKKVMAQLELKAQRKRKSIAWERMQRILIQFPNPFDDYVYNVEDLAGQYLSRATRLNDSDAVVRIVSGWQLNWCFLVIVLWSGIGNACELASWDENGEVGGPTTQLAVGTWVFSAFLRLCILEPSLIICHALVPDFVRWFLRTYLKGPSLEPGHFICESEMTLGSASTPVEMFTVTSPWR